VFQRRCEGCHQARLVADDASSRVPFERWEPLLFAPAAPIVWASNDYARTGVVPYVNEQGARVVSLRRLYKKYPYFTNGSAKNLTEVLDRAGFDDRQFFHEGSLDGAGRLGRAEKDELRAFLELL
jgi:cytochrome c peroxidase